MTREKNELSGSLRRAIVPAVLVVFMGSGVSVASAQSTPFGSTNQPAAQQAWQRIYIPQVVAANGTPMEAAQVRTWITARRISVTAEPMVPATAREVGQRYALKALKSGAMYADIPSNLTNISFIYWTKQENLFQVFEMGMQQPLEISANSFEIEGEDKWLKNGLLATGRPTGPMLELLAMQADALAKATKKARVDDGDKMTQERYLELRSRISSITMELNFELQKAAELQGDKERLDAKLALLNELKRPLGDDEYKKATSPLIAQQEQLKDELADVSSHEAAAKRARDSLSRELGELSEVNFVWKR